MSKVVLAKEDADKLAVTYSPRKFPTVISTTAHDFVAYNANGGTAGGPTSFRVDKLVAQQTGIAELERLSLEEKVEREALNRLKEFQEQAYQEAYQLGLDEGRERAFKEQSSELSEKMSHLNELLTSIERLKLDLIACNETQIVRMIFFMAKKLVYQEISAKPEIVLETVRQALAGAQSDEKVNVRLSVSDHAFIEKSREKLGKEFEAIKRVRLEPSDDIVSGGCVVETNYGDVNATLEQRLDRMWQSVSEKLPKVKNTISMDPEKAAATDSGADTEPNGKPDGESSGEGS